MPGPDDTQRESSISRLAEEFIRRTGLKSGKRRESLGEETVREEGTTQRFNISSPVVASVWNLFVFGGGFLYLGRPFLATIFLFLLLSGGTLFVSLAGIVPGWIGEPILRSLRWNAALGPSLTVTGALFSFSWWASIVLGLLLGRRALPVKFRAIRSRPALLLLSPLPMVGHFSQARVWRGALFGIFYFWVPIAGATVFRFWKDSALSPMAEVAKMEPHFALAVAVFFLSLLISLAGFASSVLGALDRIGWLRSPREGAATEWKFVLLGSLLAFSALLFAFAGRPGEIARERARDVSVLLQSRGFSRSAEGVRIVAREWERRAGPVKEFAGRFR